MSDVVARMLGLAEPPKDVPQPVHVPTVLELAAQQLATPVRGTSPVAYHLTPEGRQRIADALDHNARVWRATHPGGDLPPRPRRRRDRQGEAP